MPTAVTPSRLIDIYQVAERLECSARTVRRLIETGRIPAPVKLRNLIRWPEAAIDDWIADGCPSPTAGGDADE